MDFRRRGLWGVRIARIFTTYGPRMAPGDGRVVSTFIGQALAGRDLTVHGDGSQTRSLCYVDNMVDALVALMEHPHEAGPINLGDPREVSILELAEEIIALARSSSRIVFCKLPEDSPRRLCPVLARAQAVLGVTPRVSLREGLQRTIDAFRQSPSSTRRGCDSGRGKPNRRTTA